MVYMLNVIRYIMICFEESDPLASFASRSNDRYVYIYVYIYIYVLLYVDVVIIVE